MPGGLGVDYVCQPDGSVKAEIGCPASWEGYSGWVHGGIGAALIDGAMTHCLFGLGVVGVTADLRLRYKRPLELGRRAEVTAFCVRRTARYHRLEACITQRGRVCISAEAIFLNKPGEKGNA